MPAGLCKPSEDIPTGQMGRFVGLILIDLAVIISVFLFNSFTSTYTFNHVNYIMRENTRRDTQYSGSIENVPGFVSKGNQDKVPFTFHKRYKVDCMKLFQGDKPTLSRLTKKLNSLRNKDGLLKVPTDKEVSRWTTKCDFFKEQRAYLSLKSLQMEEDFPIAYVITAHENAAQVERLLRSVYNPGNVYCIHPDTKSPPAFQRAIRDITNCFDNVIVASKPVSVMRFNISLALCDLICMEDLLKFSPKWKYLINLCSTDFPLKTNKEIIEYLQTLDGHNGIWSNRHKNLDNTSKRWRYKYVYNTIGKNQYFPKNTQIEKEPPPHGIEVYQGSRYIAGTREFIDFVVNSQIAKDFLFWLNDTMIPDASFTPTLHMYPSAPGGGMPKVKPQMRYLTWLVIIQLVTANLFMLFASIIQVTYNICIMQNKCLLISYNMDSTL